MHINSEISDEKLIKLYNSGEEGAFAVLVQRHLSSVCVFARGYVGDDDKAEDIAQETFVKAWKSIDSFDLKRNFRVWLFTIAKNTALDYLRRRESIPLSLLEDENGETIIDKFVPAGVAQEEILDAKLLALKARGALASLPENHQRIFSLRVDSDLTFKDIAILLKRPLNTVKSNYRRAILTLRSVLSETAPNDMG